MEKIIIAGPASQILGVKISHELGVQCLNTETKTFPDGENYLRINLEDETLIEGNEIIIVQSTGPSATRDQNSRLFELFMMIDAVKRMGASKVVVVVPYLAYARQDKIFRPGECAFADVVLRIIDSMRIDELYVVDVHAPEVLKELICNKVVNIDSMKLLADYIKSLGLENIVVVSPDEGAVERSKQFAKHFGDDVPVDFFEKKRDVKTGEISMKGSLRLENKNVVIADDIIATGGTMANAIKIARESGAKRIVAAATHALLLEQAKFRILNAGAELIVGTDSIDNEAAKVSLVKAIADYLK
ncbi:MAG: ribose-phosphate diphosphokinase [Candidatus Lokiarchaeota archaeon]|nr:ribose-phosphate diphosphokinase [Candidatus Lokiarchaeota archaeon]MBD3342506.1 ribose-phosphate diphosphokinase [Candidatus Lokiarchaeota archaeon]